MTTKIDINIIVKQLLAKIKEMPVGTWTSTVSLLRDNTADFEILRDSLMDIHYSLLVAAEEEDICLDMSSHDDKDEGMPYNLELQIRRYPEPEEPDEYNVISPVPYFNKYLELIFANDDLWNNFQFYVKQTMPERGNRFFERRRDPECVGIWRQMLENMGGGIPLSLFASAAFLLLAYKDQGHDLDAELEALK